MNKHQFIEEVVNQRMVKTTHLIVKKGNSYNINEDPFQAFKDGKNLTLSKSELSYCLALMAKHYKSIMDLVEDYERYPGTLLGKEAVVDEKIGDLIAYLVNLEGMFITIMQRLKDESGISNKEKQDFFVKESVKEFMVEDPPIKLYEPTPEDIEKLKKIAEEMRISKLDVKERDCGRYGPPYDIEVDCAPRVGSEVIYNTTEEPKLERLNISEIS